MFLKSILLVFFTAFIPYFAHGLDPAVLNNSATVYERAFEVMPKLDENQKKAIKQKFSINDDAMTELVGRFGPALKLFYVAVEMECCDWGLDYSLAGC